MPLSLEMFEFALDLKWYLYPLMIFLLKKEQNISFRKDYFVLINLLVETFIWDDPSSLVTQLSRWRSANGKFPPSVNSTVLLIVPIDLNIDCKSIVAGCEYVSSSNNSK